MSFIQEPQELKDLIDTTNLIQKFFCFLFCADTVAKKFYHLYLTYLYSYYMHFMQLYTGFLLSFYTQSGVDHNNLITINFQ